MNFEEKTLSSEYVFRGKVIDVKRDDILVSNGNTSIREVVEHSGGVVILALKEDKVLTVKQFRYPIKQTSIELPAGKLEKGENPLLAGKRELREEAGVSASQYINLGEFYPSPGYTNEVIYLYGARDLTQLEQDLDEDEFLNVEYIPLDKAVDMVLNNEIKDGKTQAAVLKLAALIERNAK